MKILHTVEFYEPSKGGAQEVVKQLSEHMVLAGHDVTVATTKLPERKQKTINGVKIQEFEISGNQVRGYHGNTTAYREYLQREKFDVVMNYAAQQWATDLYFEVINKLTAKKIFVPCGFSGLYDQAYNRYFSQMSGWLKEYDASVYLSSSYRDIDFAREHKIPNLHIIPNGADEREFNVLPKSNIRFELGIPANDFLVLHVGSHTGLKGHSDAMRLFSNKAIQNATLLINGNDFGGLESCRQACYRTARNLNLKWKLTGQRKKIIMTDLERDKVLAAYRSADLFLFPSNIEASPLVLFEACASKTPFLATDVGNSREIAKWTGGGEILPTTKDSKGYSHVKRAESVKVLEGLYHNQNKRQKLAEKGFENWKKKFTWEKIAKQYLDLYTK